MIGKDRIDSIKNTVDIVALVKSKGIFLKKNGKGYMGLCPFHEDKKPSLSVNPQTNLFQCFGCGKGGDVIRFVELFDQVPFPEAVKRLQSDSPAMKREPVSTDVDIPNDQHIIDRVAEIYANTFTQTEKGRNYLINRGITDAGLFTKHMIGFCNGTLNKILPEKGDIRKTLNQAGILYEDGTERYLNCVMFPVYDLNNRVITLYGRHIDDTSEKKHLYLPKRPTGLWNGAIIKTYPEIILTESVIDALSVQMAGFSNVASIQNVNGLTEREIMDFSIYGVRKVILLLDGDRPGQEASLRLKEKLHRFAVEIRTLPDDHDPNTYLMAFGPQKLAEFI
ncbi:MAG: CHC2 zinc finger domain-containing protein, partial [bacterium]|nr:CHC2 zinc finger domain-containing protein [bacterium]